MQFRIVETKYGFQPQVKRWRFGFWQNLTRWWGNLSFGSIPGYKDYRIAYGSDFICRERNDAEQMIEEAKNQPELKSISYYGVGPRFCDGYKRESNAVT